MVKSFGRIHSGFRIVDKVEFMCIYTFNLIQMSDYYESEIEPIVGVDFNNSKKKKNL